MADFEVRFQGGPADGQFRRVAVVPGKHEPARFMEFILPWPGSERVPCGGVRWVELFRYVRTTTRFVTQGQVWHYRYQGSFTAVQEIRC